MASLLAPAFSVETTSATRHGLRSPKGGCVVDGRFYRGGCFCRPFNPDNVHELPVVEVADASYLQATTEGSVKLTKMTTRETHEVTRVDGALTCSCKGFTYRGACRHTAHVEAAGLLPVAPPEDLTFDDFTADADDLVVAPLASVEPWPVLPGLTASYRAKLMASIENELAERHVPVALHAAEVWGDTSDRDFLARLDEQWASIDEQDRELVKEWMDTIGYTPSEGPFADDELWWAFVRDCLEGCPVEFPEPQGETSGVGSLVFQPSFEDEREYAALIFGDEARAFDAWIDELATEREPQDWHESERVEAVGALLARVI